MTIPTQVLQGIHVLELGQLIAGPSTAKTLVNLGAQVIKVESPGQGDPLRKWRMLHGGTSVWWEAQSRNKQSVCVDLRVPKGQEVARKPVVEADVLIENFRLDTMKKWGSLYEALSAVNPKLTMLRVPGYGQTGPKRDKPGFAATAEAMAGLRYLTGESGRPSARVGLSLGDTIIGLHGVLGVLLALYERDMRGGKGQVTDMALYEFVFNLTESLLPEYLVFGAIRQPAGGALPGIAPLNAYCCVGGEYALIAANGDDIFRRLMQHMGRQDLADGPGLARNDGRAIRAEEIDVAVNAWTSTLPIADVLAALYTAEVSCGPIYTVADIAADPHYRARSVIETVRAQPDIEVEMPGVVSRLFATPGVVQVSASRLGQHTRGVLRGHGLTDAQINALVSQGIIAEARSQTARTIPHVALQIVAVISPPKQ